MRTLSFIGNALTPALAMVLFVSGAPATARDKADGAPKVNDKIMPFLAAAQDDIGKKNYADVAAQLAKAEPLAVSPYEKFICGQFKAIAGQGLKDDVALNAGLDEAVDSGYTGDGVAKFAQISGQKAYSVKNYSKAVQRLGLAYQLGNIDPVDIEMLADADFRIGKAADGLAAYDKAITDDVAAKRTSPADYYIMAAQGALDAKMYPEANLWIRRLVVAYPSSKAWHDVLSFYIGTHTLGAQPTLDSYRLMRATKSFHDEREIKDYVETAMDKSGLPGEAAAAFQVGAEEGVLANLSPTMVGVKASANGRAAADKATLGVSERSANASPLGKIAKGTGDAYFSFGEYAKALGLYQLALQKGGVDVNLVTMRMAEAQALTGDKAGAKANFAKVTGDEAEIAGLWTLWLSQ